MLDAEVESLEYRHGRWEAGTRGGTRAAKSIVWVSHVSHRLIRHRGLAIL